MNNSLHTPNITVIRTENTFNLQSAVDKSEIEKTITMCSINVDDEMEEFSIILYTFSFFFALHYNLISLHSLLVLLSLFQFQCAAKRRPENGKLEKVFLWNHITNYLHVRNTRQRVESNCIDKTKHERNSIHLYERWVIGLDRQRRTCHTASSSHSVGWLG